MKPAEAVELIADAVPRERGVWADLGCGDGTFTRALSELLEPRSRIYAVDRDAAALAKVARWARGAEADVITVTADFATPFALPGLEDQKLDGMLLANALHFVDDAGHVLQRLVAWLRPGGRVVIVEYDRRAASRWVPFPIPSTSLPTLAAAAGLSSPVVTGMRSSAYGGDLYVAYACLSADPGSTPEE